jgi:hypothetical protein
MIYLIRIHSLWHDFCGIANFNSLITIFGMIFAILLTFLAFERTYRVKAWHGICGFAHFFSSGANEPHMWVIFYYDGFGMVFVASSLLCIT